VFVADVDLQMVQISLRVLFRPDGQNLPHVYRRLGTGNGGLPRRRVCTCSSLHLFVDYDARVLPSIVNEVTKAVIAQYNASELLTKRNAVSAQISSMLQRRAREFGIILEDVGITHLQFSKEYTAAVEAKQVAQQDAERAKYIVDRALQEKKSIIIRAQGEAQSATLIGNVSGVDLYVGVDAMSDTGVLCLLAGHQQEPCFLVPPKNRGFQRGKLQSWKWCRSLWMCVLPLVLCLLCDRSPKRWYNPTTRYTWTPTPC
jgi:hypothetical protein